MKGIDIRYSATFNPAAPRKQIQNHTRRPRLVSDPTGYIEARSAPAPGGCRLWTGSVNGRGVGNAGDGDIAARVAFRAYFGDVPVGHAVRSSCDNLLCVAREHLYATKERRAPGARKAIGG